MIFPPHIRVYVVGGAVRDRLLGLAVRDRDHVVVGATPEDMARLGFRPVGKDFPVFLHPETGEEYALARTERKTARGYTGFAVHAAPDVSLEEDLKRRDLTINAMAETEDGEIIDPHGGRADLEARLLRHVSRSFVEDPVRILRVARFAARFGEFAVAPETLEPHEKHGGRRRGGCPGAGAGLAGVGAGPDGGDAFPDVPGAAGVRRPGQAAARTGPAVRRAPARQAPSGGGHRHPHHAGGGRGRRPGVALPERWAALLHDLGKGATPAEFWPRHHGHEGRGVALVQAACERLRAPSECRDLAVLVAQDHGNAHRALELRPATLVELLERLDAFRRPERFEAFLSACAADFRGRPGHENLPYPQADRLRGALLAARGVDAGAIARSARPADIPRAIRAARVAAVADSLEVKP
jgi:tRNA nucleotidyltransferase (CCA-adding enzyme)